MKTYTYTFQRYGYFLSSGSDKVCFGEELRILLELEPVDYELKLSGRALNKAFCPGYKIAVSKQGGVELRDWQEKTLAVFPATEKTFRECKLVWKQENIQVIFGHTEEVDNYPNCDGESDRWSTVWVAEHTVALDTDAHQGKPQ